MKFYTTNIWSINKGIPSYFFFKKTEQCRFSCSVQRFLFNLTPLCVLSSLIPTENCKLPDFGNVTLVPIILIKLISLYLYFEIAKEIKTLFDKKKSVVVQQKEMEGKDKVERE